MQKDNILYGLEPFERIVSVEAKDDKAEIFLEDKQGRVQRRIFENKDWILSNRPVDQSWTRLSGQLHYRYIKYLDSYSEVYQIKKNNKHLDFFTIADAKERFLVTNGFTYHKGMKHGEISVLSFDIETTGLYHDNDAKILSISNTFRKNNVITRKMFCYDEYETQGELLKAWCKWVYSIDPSVITGFNINMFDLPYMAFIAEKEEVKLRLGRDESPLYFNKWESKFRKDGSQSHHYFKPHIYGREIIDSYFMAIKHDVGRKYESYKLKYIIKFEGLEKKDRTFYDASLIRENYKIPAEWLKIKAYCADDGDDGLALYDLYSAPFFYSAQIIPKSFQLITESAEGSKINSLMVRSYIQEHHSLPKQTESYHFEGAISLGNPGIYKNVFKIDVASLYPSIMINWEVCDEKKDPKKYFLHIVKELTNQRLTNKALAKETKDPYYTGLEQSQKILINSAYGFLGAEGLLFNSPEKAEFITGMGRDILSTAMNWCKNKLFTLVNADTDSISFCKPDGSSFTEKERQELLNEINDLFPSRIKFEDDGYYDWIIVVKAKNYILKTGDQIKYKGSAIKATAKEAALKQFIKDIIESIFNEKRNYLEIYNSYVKEILDIKDITRWCSKKTITTKTMESKRANETKIKDAIEDSEYGEGDKVYTYFDQDLNLKLVENFDGKYNVDKLLEKLYKTALTFESIIEKETFINYKLKKKKVLLNDFNKIS